MPYGYFIELVDAFGVDNVSHINPFSDISPEHFRLLLSRLCDHSTLSLEIDQTICKRRLFELSILEFFTKWRDGDFRFFLEAFDSVYDPIDH